MLLRVSEQIGTTFVFLHHSTTKQRESGGDARGDGRGSSAIYDSSGAVFSMKGKPGEPIQVTQTKPWERGVLCEPFYLFIGDVEVDGDPRGGVAVVHKSTVEVESKNSKMAKREAVEQAIVDYIKADRGCSKRAIRAGVSGRAVDIDAALEHLLDRERIVDLGDSKRQRLQVKN